MSFLKDIWANKWIKLLVLLAGLCLMFWFIARIHQILTALALAWLLAYICDPLVDRLERRRVPRTAGVAVLAVCLILGAVLIDLILVPTVLHELQRLSQELPNYGDWLTGTLLPQIEATLGIELPRTDADIRGFFYANRDTVNQIAQAVYSPVTSALKNAWSGVLGFITGLLTLLVIPVAWFYLLRDIDRINAGAVELIPLPWREPFAEFMRQVDVIVANFLRGQITVALILGSLYSVGLWLILDIPLGLVIGLFAGLASIVPYLGLVLGIVPALLMALLQYQDWQHPLGVVAVFLVAQALEGNLITPKIVGDKLGLHPVTVIFALLIWAELAGLLGMLIAVPATAVLQVLAVRLVHRYKSGGFYRGAAPK
ncbi:MAG: AI-2E family transporter [Myxococcales bacterium]|nr:AI-2E family transporter [Myxococcales bacterium]